MKRQPFHAEIRRFYYPLSPNLRQGCLETETPEETAKDALVPQSILPLVRFIPSASAPGLTLRRETRYPSCRLPLPEEGKHSMPSKWAYYLRSMFTLLAGIRNPGAVTRLILLRPRGATVVRLRDGSSFRVRSLMDLWIVKETCLDRDYEKNLPPLEEDAAVMDIGAGLGDFTVRAARNHPRRNVAAFEPFAESFRLLEENLKLNGILNAQAFPLAVGARSGPMLLQTATGVAVQHSTAPAAGPGGASSLPVEGITLEEAFRKSGFARCTLLKVDCEGGEYDILLNASPETLHRIDRIAMEYHDGCTPHSHHELADFLRGRGFSVNLRPNPVHRHLGFLTAARTR
jgi:FkbM family methyltransferase